jgi:hypothetical protein
VLNVVPRECIIRPGEPQGERERGARRLFSIFKTCRTRHTKISWLLLDYSPHGRVDYFVLERSRRYGHLEEDVKGVRFVHCKWERLEISTQAFKI